MTYLNPAALCLPQSSSSTQVVLRALYALEAVLVHGSSQACGEVAVMFQSDPGSVRETVVAMLGRHAARDARCVI